MKIVKFLVFGFNLLFLIFGAVLIGVGAYVQIQLKDYLDFIDLAGGSVNGPAIVLIVFGAITFVVAFFGCCGAIKENRCMVMIFAALISLILICELAGGIAAFVLKNKMAAGIKDAMETSLKQGSGNGTLAVWNSIQHDLQCCGVDGSSDWNRVDKPIPDACCADGKDCHTSKKYFDKGCYEGVENAIVSNIGYVAGAGVGLAVVEILGIILSCCLANAIKNEYEVA